MTGTYRIPDEPLPSGLARYATRPYFPLLAMMIGGSFVAFPWFAFNAYALNGPRRAREALLAAASPLGTLLLLYVAIGVWPSPGERGAAYVHLGLTAYKLGIAYWLHELQEPTASLFEHFGGNLRNATGVVIAAALARATVLHALGDVSPLLALVLA